MAHTGNPSLDRRAEAVRLRGLGLTLQTIADRLCVSESQVRRLTSPTGPKKQTIKPTDRTPKYSDGHGAAERGTRVVRRIIAPPDRIVEAAREFAAGRISRNELMLRVSDRGVSA